MMKNIKKVMVVAVAFAAVTLVGIGSTANKADAKKKYNRLTAKYPVSLNTKESKKYCKAGKIKFVYDTEKNRFKLTSFKKNKYAPVSKKMFLKKLDATGFCWIDGKKYGPGIKHKDVKGYDGDSLANGGDLSFLCCAEGLSKALTPGKHKVKVEFCFHGDKKGRYNKCFFWTGTINIKEAYNVSGNKAKISHLEYRENDFGATPNYKTSIFSISNILANVDCKLNINVKYVFDKNHIRNKNQFNQSLKNSGLTEDELMNYINSQIGNEASFSSAIDVPKWNSDKAYFNPYSIDISKYSNYNNLVTKANSTVRFCINPDAFWGMFAPDVTCTFTSKATGKVLGNETAVVK